MIPAGVQMWSLSEGGSKSLGLSCTQDGLFLGRTPLIERRGGSYAVRPRRDLERLLSRAYQPEINLDWIMPGLAVVELALGERNLCLAQIAAVQLRVPELSDQHARDGMEAEDRLIKGERGGVLARGGWDPAEHPRAGVPPNPGWFAPTDGSSAGGSRQVAQGEEDERAPEEMLDPLAPVRQAQWDAAIATLREIDPSNPNLTYFADPNSAPGQAALDRLNAAVEAAAIKRVTDKVMPGGVPVGEPGRGPDVRELPGGLAAARDLFNHLRTGGRQVERPDLEGSLAKLPGSAGYITFRATSTSGPPAVDVNVPGARLKLHFP